MKKLAALVLALIMIPSLAFAEVQPVSLYVNGISGDSFENRPIVKDDRLFIPLRSVIETMGYKVDWNDKTRTVLIDRGTVKMVVDQKDYINHGKKATMDVAPFIEKDRTYVPIRFVAESMKVPVKWDESQRTAIIGSYKAKVDYAPAEKVTIGDVTISLPKDWDKQLKIKKEGGKLTFYDKLNYEADNGMGRVGEICVEDNPYMIPVPHLLLDHDLFYTIFAFSSDVQVVDINNKDQVYSYTKSEELVKKILKTATVSHPFKEADRVTKGGVSFIYPKAYQDKVGVKMVNNQLTFYDKVNDKAEKGMGIIGSFILVKNMDDVQVNYQYVKPVGKQHLVFAYASDVQLAKMNDAKLAEAYNQAKALANNMVLTAK